MGTLSKDRLDEINLLEKYVFQIFGRYDFNDRKVGDVAVKILQGVKARDDCAVIQIGDVALVASTDFIRGTGFNLFRDGYLTYHDLGYFLAVANISDVASMGAIPFALLVVIRYSEEMTEDDFRGVLEGLDEAAKEYDTPIIGGDTGGANNTVLSATALGFCGKDEYLLRHAESNQYLCVTGSVGRSFAARAYFEKAKPKGFTLRPDLEEELLLAWKHPVARVKEGYVIRKYASACQDVSDGLKATIEQITQHHGIGADISEDMLPIDESTKRVADYFKISHAALALTDSCDFELLFSVPDEKLTALQRQFSNKEFRLSVIGRTNSSKQCALVSGNGERRTPLPGIAWRSQWGSVIDELIAQESQVQ